MNIKIDEILSFLKKMDIEHKYHGKTDITIDKFSSLKNLENTSITWIKDQVYYKKEYFRGLQNVLIIISDEIDIEDIDNPHFGFIICKNPKETFFSILDEFFKQQELTDYISTHSVIETKLIGQNVYIGHNCYIGKDVKIGNNVIIKNNASIEGKVEIGNDTVIHSGTVIGTDGYGYFQNNEGKNVKVPHYGGVIIGENVEIGANTCIDRGTLDNTIIGNNVKIDNLCHIAHNVVIEENSMVIALSMLGGSVLLEKNSYIAPGALIKNQLVIGENSLVGMGAVAVKDVEKNKVVAGVPAKVIKDNK